MQHFLKSLCWLWLFLSATLVFAQFGVGLPDWAEAVLTKTGQQNPPTNTDLWRLYDETTIMPHRDGRILVQRRIVQQVTSEAGTEKAAIFFVDNMMQISVQHSVKGWHRNSDGKIVKLERDNIWSLSLANHRQHSHHAVTTARFDGVGRHSLVVFESKEIRDPLFTHDLIPAARDFPIAEQVVDIRLPGATLVPVNFAAWALDSKTQASRTTVYNTPTLREEPMTSNDLFVLPYIWISYASGKEQTAPLTDWSTFGRWYNRRFQESAAVTDPEQPLHAPAALTEILAQQQKSVSYRQRYLTPQRGWYPAEGARVAERKYGDCKDMTACLAFLAGQQQISVYPTLARVYRDFDPGPDTPVSPFAFNHLIAAVPLSKSLGLAAEVLVNDQHFLLVDPTAKGTTPGRLPAEYRGRSVLLCLPQGGRWVKVPDQALDKAALDVELTGRLDPRLTLDGTMTITSRGNALGLRTNQSSLPVRLERLVRKGLKLPSSAEITLVAIDRADPGKVTTTCHISWPSFLRHDDDGYRLPTCMVPAAKTSLQESERRRQQPLLLPNQTPITWNLSLQSSRVWKPGLTTTSWKDPFRSFSWQARGGKSFSVKYHQTGRRRLYAKQELQTGIDTWENYRTNYNSFYLAATLFREIEDETNSVDNQP